MGKHEWLLEVFEELRTYAIDHKYSNLAVSINRAKEIAKKEVFREEMEESSSSKRKEPRFYIVE
jgi:hypothetical protein